jgi:dethiobiotin synthetase
VILISQNYLGSINHTLMSANVLNQYKIKVAGIIFNGVENQESQRYILQYTKLKNLGYIPNFDRVNPENVKLAGDLILL